MANILGDKFAVIDTFGADVELARDKWIKVMSIIVSADSATRKAYFKDESGRVIFVISSDKEKAFPYNPPQPVCVEGLVYDDTLSNLASGDHIIIHFA